MTERGLPVAVIGAGPVGLAAAAHLVHRGETPVVLESGETAGASVLKWGHVRIFSPWRYNADPVAAAMLDAAGWARPRDDDYPTGKELVSRYLSPLADLPAIRPHLRFGARVLGVSRRSMDRTKTSGREKEPFVLRVDDRGVECDVLARAVIDASGTYESSNPLGGNGLPALGESAARDDVFYGIPDVLGRDRARFEQRRVLVVGSGHSAFGVLLDLEDLRTRAPRTEVLWAVRRPSLRGVFGDGETDRWIERGRLGDRMRALLDRQAVRVHTHFRISRITPTPAGVVVEDEDAQLPPVDVIVAATGFRPDLSLFHDIRLDLDPVVQSPAQLAPLIDPNLHSCGTVPPHGFELLRQPEPDLYVVGMKSYGRAPTFLMLIGYEQVRSVVAAISGDLESAHRIELTLPHGVCAANGDPAGCCAPAAAC